jgi:hypothetical protein
VGKAEPADGLPSRFLVLGFALAVALSGCGREPTRREVENARAFEALLTAVSLKNSQELERDARLIEERHAAGDLSARNYEQIAQVIARARAGDWSGAETRAYAFRAQFGDDGAYFK